MKEQNYFVRDSIPSVSQVLQSRHHEDDITNIPEIKYAWHYVRKNVYLVMRTRVIQL